MQISKRAAFPHLAGWFGPLPLAAQPLEVGRRVVYWPFVLAPDRAFFVADRHHRLSGLVLNEGVS